MHFFSLSVVHHLQHIPALKQPSVTSQPASGPDGQQQNSISSKYFIFSLFVLTITIGTIEVIAIYILAVLGAWQAMIVIANTK